MSVTERCASPGERFFGLPEQNARTAPVGAVYCEYVRHWHQLWTAIRHPARQYRSQNIIQRWLVGLIEQSPVRLGHCVRKGSRPRNRVDVGIVARFVIGLKGWIHGAKDDRQDQMGQR